MRCCFQGRWTCPLVSENHHFSVEMPPFWLKYMYSILSAFTWRPMPPAVCSRLGSRNSAWIGVFARNAMPFTWSASMIVFAGYHLLFAFLVYCHFLSLDLSTFEVHSPCRLWTNMGLMYPLAEHQQQCQRSLRLSPVNKPWLLCFYWALIWLWQFI